MEYNANNHKGQRRIPEHHERSKSINLPMLHGHDYQPQGNKEFRELQNLRQTSNLSQSGRSKSVNLCNGGSDGRTQILRPNPVRRVSSNQLSTLRLDGSDSDWGSFPLGGDCVQTKFESSFDVNGLSKDGHLLAPAPEHATGRSTAFAPVHVNTTTVTPTSNGSIEVIERGHSSIDCRDVWNPVVAPSSAKPALYDQSQRQFSCETVKISNLSTPHHYNDNDSHNRHYSRPSLSAFSFDEDEECRALSHSIHRISMESSNEKQKNDSSIFNSPRPRLMSNPTTADSLNSDAPNTPEIVSREANTSFVNRQHPDQSLFSPSKCFVPLNSCPNTPGTQASTADFSNGIATTTYGAATASTLSIDRVNSTLTEGTDLEFTSVHNAQFLRSKLSREDSFASPVIERVDSNITVDSLDMEVRDFNRREIQRRKILDYQNYARSSSSMRHDRPGATGIAQQRHGLGMPLSAMSIDEEDTLTLASSSSISSAAYWRLNAEPLGKSIAGGLQPAPPSPYKPRDGAVLSLDRWFDNAPIRHQDS